MNVTSEFSLVFGVVYLLTMAAAAFQPYYSPKNILFGISIPPDEAMSDSVVGLRKRYVLQVLACGLIFGIALTAVIAWKANGAAAQEEASVWLTTVPIGGLLAHLGIAGSLFAVYHQKAYRLKEDHEWQDTVMRAAADLTIRRSGWPTAGRRSFLICSSSWCLQERYSCCMARFKSPLLPITMHRAFPTGSYPNHMDSYFS